MEDDLLTRSDTLLESKDWASVVGKISEVCSQMFFSLHNWQFIYSCLILQHQWIDLDNSDAKVRKTAEFIFRQECEWASHLGLPVIYCPPVLSVRCPNYAKMVHALCMQSPNQQIWLQVPLVVPLNYRNSSSEEDDGWVVWRNFKV